MGLDKDKYASNGFGVTSCSGNSSGFGTAGINKDENIDGSFSDAGAGKVDESLRKQLKVSKFNILVAVIHYQRSYFQKKLQLQNFFRLFL